MYTRRLSLLLVAVIAAVIAAACAETTAPIDPQPLPALEDQVWHVNVSDGQPLPALLGHRLAPGGILEQDFLDSARFEIRADGSWEQLGWYQRYRSGQHYMWASTLNWGTWTATPTAYEFRRNTGELLYTVAGPIGSELQMNLRYGGQSGVAVSQLRRTRPALDIYGRWRANALRDQPLPAAYIVENGDYGEGPVSRHIVIDSAVVWLYPTGQYLQRIFHSEWEGAVDGPAERKLRELVEADYGFWNRNGLQLSLLSNWLENKTMLGEASANAGGPLRLQHGITHGDEPAAFRYVRW
ncbi:MAG: hypothetical protein C0503_02345 [Gemmatimonas sp.]|nr:hypothetical protein [Gemmatimonas sp.]